jgi:hypothetical protein
MVLPTKHFGSPEQLNHLSNKKKNHCRLGSKNCIYIYSKNYVTDFFVDLRVPNILVDKKKTLCVATMFFFSGQNIWYP